MTVELQSYEADAVVLADWIEPTGFLDEVSAVATALGDIIERQRLYAVMGRDRDGNPRKHIVVEAWQTLAAMHRLSPVVAWSKPTDDFLPREIVTTWDRGKKNVDSITVGRGGWEARCEVLDAVGNVVGAAEAECRYEEENWRDRDSYALRSMAQTRAIAKALRGKLAYVVTLAGYQTTPAEEMPVRVRHPEHVAKDKVLELTGDEDAARELWDAVLEDLGLETVESDEEARSVVQRAGEMHEALQAVEVEAASDEQNAVSDAETPL